MKGKKIFCALAFALSGLSSLPLAGQSLLPSSVGGWMASGPATQAVPAQIEQFASDRAALLREYGVMSGEQREYTEGADQLTVTVYRMVDPSAAFGAFTFLREPGMNALPATNPVSYAAAGRGRTVFVVGNLVMDAASKKSPIAAAEVSALAQSVASQADRRPYPPIAEFLPKPGLIPGSERYILGPLALAQAFPEGAATSADWAGFASSAEAIAGRYRIPGNGRTSEATLLLILYPTQQLAADRYGSLGKSFALNVDSGATNGRPMLFGTRSAALIALLSGAESREAAANFLSQVHYASEVTWNEPTHELTDPTISTIVVGAILDTGAIMLLVMAASLGFGGFRLLAKVVAPGKIFDRNAEVEILQLGINSKPVDVKDFYVLHSSR